MLFHKPVLVSLFVFQELVYLELLLHLRFEVDNLLLGLKLVSLRLLQVAKHAFLFDLKSIPFAIILSLDNLSQLTCFSQFLLGGLELRDLSPPTQGLLQ